MNWGMRTEEVRFGTYSTQGVSKFWYAVIKNFAYVFWDPCILTIYRNVRISDDRFFVYVLL